MYWILTKEKYITDFCDFPPVFFSVDFVRCHVLYLQLTVNHTYIFQYISIKGSGSFELVYFHHKKTASDEWFSISIHFLRKLAMYKIEILYGCSVRFGIDDCKIKVHTFYMHPKSKWKLTGFFPTINFSTSWTWDTWSSVVPSSRFRIRSYIPTSIFRGMSSPSSTPVRKFGERGAVNIMIYESKQTPDFTFCCSIQPQSTKLSSSKER